MVPRYSYGQCSIGAASGTVLDVLRTQKLKENEEDFTDLRILGACGAEGEGQTRNCESSYRRKVNNPVPTPGLGRGNPEFRTTRLPGKPRRVGTAGAGPQIRKNP